LYTINGFLKFNTENLKRPEIMLTYSLTNKTETFTSAYSFGLFAGYKHKKALYSQILSNAGLKSGDVVLAMSCSDESTSDIIAEINVVQANPLGGLPGMLEVSAIETGFGKNNQQQSDLPWTEGTFDTILLIGVFNHLANHEKTISHLRQLLSPSGKLIIADQWFRVAGPMFADLLQPYTLKSEFRIYSPAFVTKILQKSGFSLIETRSAGATNFLCTATTIK
jgi:cyclopropane fatty-acyl-phospholipid synthase-like methyltransferase